MITDIDKIRSDAMVIANALINKTEFLEGFRFEKEWHVNKLEKIIDLSVKEAIRANKITLEELNKKVSCGDLVLVKQANNKTIRYLLSRFLLGLQEVDVIGGAKEYYFKTLDVHSNLGLALIGKSVGEEVTYSEGNEKNIHTVKILSIRKTELSEDLSLEELKVDDKNYYRR